jgi:YVTN family beta-propeller protein
MGYRNLSSALKKSRQTATVPLSDAGLFFEQSQFWINQRLAGTKKSFGRFLLMTASRYCCALFTISFALSVLAQEQDSPQVLPTGMMITPLAAKGSSLQLLNPDVPDLPQFTADHPVSSAVSPDGKTLLVLTSGYNRNNDEKGEAIKAQSNEYIFVYDIRQQVPVKQQVLQVPNAFVGIAWNPNGQAFYVSGGVDDCVHAFEEVNGRWREQQPPIKLGHAKGLGLDEKPLTAGVAVNSSGTRLLAVNYQNDSVSIVDLKSREKTAELDLRPGQINPAKKGIAGGEYPYWAIFKGDDKAYVSSLRDREIVVLDLHRIPRVSGRIKIQGQPNKLILNKAQTLLFTAVDNSDSVTVIDSNVDRIITTIKTTAPPATFLNKESMEGSNPNSLALSPDEQTLYVTNGGTNSVAVIRLAPDARRNAVTGLIPTAWYPGSISLKADGSALYVLIAKSIAGPNPKGCRDTMVSADHTECEINQQFIWQLEKGALLTIPRPGDDELKELTTLVARNNYFTQQRPATDPIFSFLREKIRHVIYIIKENRTYDQVLGDLEKGNGDPALALFKKPFTPNHHQLARQFVVLDNFYDSGEVSGIGWNWSTAGRATDITEKTIPLNSSKRGPAYDYEGTNRGINVAIASPKDRHDASLRDPDDQLPGTADVLAPDGPNGAVEAGYIWDAALRAKRTVRNYGFFVVLPPDKSPVPPHNPAAIGRRVAVAANPRLRKITDPYYAGYDQRYPDYWRYKEWEREFDSFVKHDNLPALELVRLPHDHFGKFKSAIDGVNTVETMMADNDYALGLMVEKVAHSKYNRDTLIFVIEDDAQNGPDHVDAHRSLAFVVGPYVKQGAVISQRYNTVSLLRTIEEVLGLKPLGLNDALQQPMSEVFTRTYAPWTYTAKIPAALRTTQLPLPKQTDASSRLMPLHNADYWETRTRGMDFSVEDRIDSEKFNLILWQGMMEEDIPYPAERNGMNLRDNREKLLQGLKARQR